MQSLFFKIQRIHFTLDAMIKYCSGFQRYFKFNLSTLNFSGIFLLTRYSEGAIYTAIVNALVTPTGALWWSIFSSEPHFHWAPGFTTTTAYTLAGLAIMVPSVVTYNIFSIQDERTEESKRSNAKNKQSAESGNDT